MRPATPTEGRSSIPTNALYEQVFATNVKAPFFLMQKSLEIMVRENIKGAVVNIISMSAHGGQSFLAAYCAAKGALVTLTKNTGFSMMRYGCRVNGLCIGWMYSPARNRRCGDGTRRRTAGVKPPKPGCRLGECSKPKKSLARSHSCAPVNPGP